MNKIDKKKLSQVNLMRIASITIPLLSVFARYMILHSIRLYEIQMALLLSCSAILMLPFYIEKRAMVLTLLAISLPWDLVDLAGTISGLKDINPTIQTLLYAVVLILPLQICIFIKVRNKVWDDGFLSGAVSGWDAAMGYLKISFALLYQPLAVSSVFIAAIGSAPKLVEIPIFVSIILFLIFLYLRTMTSTKWLIDDRKYSISRNIDFVFTPESLPAADSSHKILFERMCSLMKEEKPFLSSTFNIDELSKALFTNRGYLSKMINSCTGMNFNTLINNYRVRHAMELFKGNPRMKVSDLMSLSGFNNPVTFNNAFKLIMKMTPGEWCYCQKKKLHEKSEMATQKKEIVSTA